MLLLLLLLLSEARNQRCVHSTLSYMWYHTHCLCRCCYVQQKQGMASAVWLTSAAGDITFSWLHSTSNKVSTSLAGMPGSVLLPA
jgi:hypothetical protein